MEEGPGMIDTYCMDIPDGQQERLGERNAQMEQRMMATEISSVSFLGECLGVLVIIKLGGCYGHSAAVGVEEVQSGLPGQRHEETGTLTKWFQSTGAVEEKVFKLSVSR